MGKPEIRCRDLSVCRHGAAFRTTVPVTVVDKSWSTVAAFQHPQSSHYTPLQ